MSLILKLCIPHPPLIFCTSRAMSAGGTLSFDSLLTSSSCSSVSCVSNACPSEFERVGWCVDRAEASFWSATGGLGGDGARMTGECLFIPISFCEEDEDEMFADVTGSTSWAGFK